MKFVLIIACVLIFNLAAFAQPSATAAVKVPASAELEKLAAAVYAAHGGEKLKGIKTIVIRGSVDVTMSSFPQAIAGAFATVISGDKYLLDIETPFQAIKQTYDGESTTSSLPGFTMPPVTTLGFPLLPKYGDKGYVVSSLPDAKKKTTGFRFTAPDGFYTDFYIDEKTNLIKGYESAYDIGGRTVTTAVEVDKNQVVDGITIPAKYSQRFDLGQLTAYSSFKAKEILVNTEVKDSIFSIAK